jgi:hypothetical protein
MNKRLRKTPSSCVPQRRATAWLAALPKTHPFVPHLTASGAPLNNKKAPLNAKFKGA